MKMQSAEQAYEKERPGNGKEDSGSRKSWRKAYIGIAVATTAAAVIYTVLRTICGIDPAQGIADLVLLKGLPELGPDAGYGILFLFGALTSFHCVGMCGGIVLSQTVGNSDSIPINKAMASAAPSALYNLGRVVSYTAVGGVVGSLGYAVGFTGVLKGLVPIVGGLFVIIMGMSLLGIFPFLRRFSLPIPGFFAGKLLRKNKYGPLSIGLLSGLVPCGPLQIVQLYALGTRSTVFGALSMLVFALGTVPLLFVFGTLNTVINKKHTLVVLRTSAVLVIILGTIMFGRGLALFGVSPDLQALSITEGNKSTARVEEGIQTVATELRTSGYTPIVVQKDIPVKWIIKVKGEDLNKCNNTIVIPELKIEKSLTEGDNLIEFTPRREGEIAFSCWMGMIKSKITVVEKIQKPIDNLRQTN